MDDLDKRLRSPEKMSMSWDNRKIRIRYLRVKPKATLTLNKSGLSLLFTLNLAQKVIPALFAVDAPKRHFEWRELGFA